MPIPKPNTDEEKDKFIHRCMSNDIMNKEFPERERRFAVCMQSWNDKGKSKSDKEPDNDRQDKAD